MKDSHGFEKVDYVPQEKKSVSATETKKLIDKIIVGAVILLIVALAVVLFIYPGYFIRVFSEAGYNFIN